MQIQRDTPLAPLTSFGVGGHAEKLITITNSTEITEALNEVGNDKLWLLGHGTNTLISDEGLPGTTLRFGGGAINAQDNILIADAGIEWDELVRISIARRLWGVELLSGVPGSVGAACFINIAAYGQHQSDCIKWVEVIDRSSSELQKLTTDEMKWDYKHSIFQENDNLVISRVAYELSPTLSTELTYQSAIDIARELDLDTKNLKHRRQLILETRTRAGSIFNYGGQYAKTVGSFFKNPLVNKHQAEIVSEFDETDRSIESLEKMNQVHGGDARRVSAALVLLAAGFKRGQSWGSVRLHPDHVLKIENTGGATAKNIYDVAQAIITTVKDQLDIELEPEARMLGKFN